MSTWNSSYSVSMLLMKFCSECRISRAQRTVRGKEVAIDVRLVALGRHQRILVRADITAECGKRMRWMTKVCADCRISGAQRVVGRAGATDVR